MKHIDSTRELDGLELEFIYGAFYPEVIQRAYVVDVLDVDRCAS